MVPPSKCTKSRKRSRSKQSADEPASKREQSIKTNCEKTTEAKKMFQTLTEKYENRYTPEQLHAWAHLIQLKKHTSLDEPPDYPYFRGNKPRKKEEQPGSNERNHEEINKTELTHSTAIISPEKKVHMRTECIDQLQKIGDLLEKRCISQRQYDKLQETITKDINQF